MISVQYSGRLANNLFQYCLGRILAEETGLSLSSSPLEGFPQTKSSCTGRTNDGTPFVLKGNFVDFDKVRAESRLRPIVLNGFFQRAEYYRSRQDDIREWLKTDDFATELPSAHDIVVHVRRTDYIHIGWALPYEFYLSAINQFRKEDSRVVILTDDPGDPFFRRFKELDVRFVQGSAIQDLTYMASARCLVLSRSSFSWWATMLASPGQLVCCPAPTFGVWKDWSQPDSVALVEKDRFVTMPCCRPYRPNLSEAIHHLKNLTRKHLKKLLKTVTHPRAQVN